MTPTFIRSYHRKTDSEILVNVNAITEIRVQYL